MNNIQGSITALITPFSGENIDEDRFCALVERQIENNTAGLVPAGTTGESATISHEEHKRLITLCVETAKGRVPVIAGAGSNSTREAIELASFAADAGADAILSVTGYYNKPSQSGLYEHYKAVDAASSLPIILYNVPGRTISAISVETMARLADLPRIIGVKDATADLSRVPLQTLACGDDFIQLSGEDMTAVGFNAMGGVGCIGVTANVAPDLCAEMQNACLTADYASACTLQNKLAPLHDVLFADTSPGPVKYAMSLMGLCSEDLRLPLSTPPQDVRERIETVLRDLALIN